MAEPSDDSSLFPELDADTPAGPVECLGMTFPSDDARRAHFLERLKEKLPELRKRPDFPLGDDEDILRLSDPPYYTACPNPFLTEFVEFYGCPYDPNEPYHREPYAVDVSEGKTDLLYRAHGYHTKVPHLAIVPSILHYTKPGDIILDGFCGSGMTGLAAQWCGNAPAEYRRKLEQHWQLEAREPPEWGARRVILGDLSPAATFIGANYNMPFDVEAFAAAAQKLLDDVSDEVGWMYQTLHTDGKTKGRINYTVWSEVFSCPECAGEIVFIEEALDRKSQRIRNEFSCPTCRTLLTKRRLDRLYVSEYDPATQQTVNTTKRVPVFINYTVGGITYEKPPRSDDIELLRTIANLGHPPEIPADRMMHIPPDTVRWGDEWSPGVAGFTHVHHLFLPRAKHALAAMWRRVLAVDDLRLRNSLAFFVEQAIPGMSLLNRYGPLHYSQVNRYMAGRIRVLSQHAECTPWYTLTGKLKRLRKAFSPMPSVRDTSIMTTGDCSRISLPNNSVDYVFTDPPFGSNLAYGELNFLGESFFRVFTNRVPEAIVSRTQKKEIFDYQAMIRDCFVEYHKALKPGRWMTVVFHNSKNSIWNAIQDALSAAGFVVADVRVMDKGQGTFNQVNAGRAVKQDLVISAYRPSEGLETSFRLRAGTANGVWDFVRAHLRKLPVFVVNDERMEIVAERQSFLLYDRMVAFHVQRGVTIPLSASEFYESLAQRYSQRDGMYFLPEQVAEYDRERMKVAEIQQLQLFVKDEETAIQWLRQHLEQKPQTFQQIHPGYMKEMGGWAKHERSLELSDLLAQNFICYDGVGEVPSQIHSYLSTNFKELRRRPNDDDGLRGKAKDRWYVPDPRKAGDLEKVRDRVLLKEFDDYAASGQKRLKVFRLEAVRAGFRRAWQARDYGTIVRVAAKIPENVLQEDAKLLMWYDQALTRVGEGL